MFAGLSIVLLALSSLVASAPLQARQSACFVPGNVALPAEVAKEVAALANVVTCGGAEIFPGIPDLTSGGVSFSSIDFQDSDLSPVGFALQTFKTPTDPADADLTLLQSQLNTYLAAEAGLRSQAGTKAVVASLKGPKFFLQFQIARARTALGESLSVAETVEHQLGKVLNNAVGASAAERAAVQALATQL